MLLDGSLRKLADQVASSTPFLTLVTSTRGRTWQLGRMLESLEGQSFRDFEVILVDQNPDDRLGEVLAARPWSFPLRRLNAQTVGLSRGRNQGAGFAKGNVLLFPDDDCWYPPDFLERGLAKMDSLGADLLCGRASTLEGRGINGRYVRTARRINKGNVWVCQIEWATFVRRSLLNALHGYDEELGLGADTPWQSAEGPDLILRAIEAGAGCFFDPSLSGFHEEIQRRRPDPVTVAKLRSYGRGKGYVLRKHRYSVLQMAYWCGRSLTNVVRWAAVGDFATARAFWQVFIGRVEGCLGATAGERLAEGPSLRDEASGRNAPQRPL